MALVPWPTTPAALAAARLRVQAVCQGGTVHTAGDGSFGPDDTRTDELGKVAASYVTMYAPSAPQEMRDEAALRIAGYIAQSDFGAISSETSVGNSLMHFVTNHASMVRNSGALALLSPWRQRRAGSIG